MKKINSIIFMVTLLVLLFGVATISATDVADDTTPVLEKSSEAVNTPVVSVDKSVKDVKKETKTHIINNETVKDVFSNTGKSEYAFNNFDTNTLDDSVNEGDILDFQGTITGNYNLTINKPVNIISSTKDAVISLNTSCADLLGTSPGNSFSIISTGSYTNVTDISFYNTQLFVINSTHVTLDHINATVNGNRVGGGIGQTSIRENSSDITVKNSYFYTNDNGGSSTFVLAYAENCTIINNTFNADGNSGNLFYFTTYNVNVPSDVIANSNNKVINNTIGQIGQSFGGIQLACVLTGANNTLDSNQIAGSISSQYGGAIGGGYTIINNNTIYGTIGLSTVSNYTITNNVIKEAMTVANNSFIENNTLGQVTLNARGNNFTLNNNNMSRLVVGGLNNLAISHNTIHDITISGNRNITIEYSNITGLISIAARASDVKIINNDIHGTEDYALNVLSAGNTIANNTITSRTYAGQDAIQSRFENIIENNTPEAGQTITVTEENYDQYFNNEGQLGYDLANYSTIILADEFNNKDFKFENIIVNLNGENSKLINTTIQTDNEALIKINNITIENKNTDKSPLVFNTDGNLVYKNKIIAENITSDIIVLNGGMAKIVNNTFNIGSPDKRILQIKSNDNNISTNNFTITANKNVEVGEIDENTESNLFFRNNVNITSSADITVFNSKNSSTINITNNNINLTTEADAYAITLEDVDKAYINNNNINVTADKTEVIKTTSQDKITDIQIKDNVLNVISQEFKGITVTNAENLDLQSNRLYANTTRSRGISVDNCKFAYYQVNQIYINNTEANDNLEKMNTATYLQNLDEQTIYADLTIVTNSAGLILNNVSNTILQGSSTHNTTNNNGIYLINSNNVRLHNKDIYTTSNYTMTLINSSNNTISFCNLITNYEYGGDDTIYQDSDSKNNTLSNNTPVIMLLTNDNYDTYFDENNTIKIHPKYITIGSDIYNKTMIINQTVESLQGLENYTLYNTTIILKDKVDWGMTVTFNNVNFNNTDKTALISKINTTRTITINYTNSTINTYGEDSSTIILDDVTNAILSITNTTLNIQSNYYFIDTKNKTAVELANNTINIDNTNSVLIEDNTARTILNHNNITVNAEEFILINGTGYIQSNYFGFTDNNINIAAYKTTLINLTITATSNKEIANNTINIKTQTPEPIINIENATGIQITDNNITVENVYGEIPIISMNPNPDSPSYYTNKVTDNYILCYDKSGDQCVKAENTTIENNKPTGQKDLQAIVTIQPINITPGNLATVTAQVTGTLDNPANDGQVYFKINGKVLRDTTTNKVIYAQVTDGIATTTVDDTTTWDDNTEVKAIYIKSTRYMDTMSETVNPTITGQEQPEFSVSDVTTTAGSEVTITVTTKNLDAGKVVLKVNGKTVKGNDGKLYAKVDGDTVTFTYTVPKTLKTGEYAIKAVYTSGTTRLEADAKLVVE